MSNHSGQHEQVTTIARLYPKIMAYVVACARNVTPPPVIEIYQVGQSKTIKMMYSFNY